MATAATSIGRDRSGPIDALRAVAALGVLAFHSQAMVGRIGHGLGFGHLVGLSLDAGVELFFVISGYLIAGPFVRALVDGRAAPDLEVYGVRRLARILPAYWATLAVLFLIGPARAGWEWLLHLVLLQSPVPGEVDRIIPVAWTLHVEIAFYLLVPLAYLAMRRRAPVPPRQLALVVLAVWAGSVATSLTAAGALRGGSGAEVAAIRSVPATVGLFCPGILLALAQTSAGRVTPLAQLWWRFLRSRAALVVGGLAVVASVVLSGRVDPVLGELRRQPEVIVAALLVGLAVSAGPRLLSASRWLAPVGAVSYSIYLWHGVVEAKLLQHPRFLPGASFGLMRLPVAAAELPALTLPVAVVSYLLVERPPMRWSHRLRPRRAPKAAPAAA